MDTPNTITIAAKSSNPLTVNRLGYGTMRLTGEAFMANRKTGPKLCRF